MTIKLTKHAVVRCQQRGIPTQVVDVLYKHGSKTRSHDDFIYHFSKKDIKRFSVDEPVLFKKYNKQLINTLIVCNGKTVITAFKSIQRNLIGWDHRDNRCIKDREHRSIKRNRKYKYDK